MSAVSFRCSCGGVMSVIDSRPSGQPGEVVIKRRRHCTRCKRRVTTYERIETEGDIGAIRTRRSYERIYVVVERIRELFKELDEQETSGH